MHYQIMPKRAFADWIRRLQQEQRVVGPVAVQGNGSGPHRFQEIGDPDELVLEYSSSLLPPKKYLIPQQEVLLSYRLDGTELEAKIELEPTIVFGVHTCDLHAIKLFDQIFSQGFADQHYQAHRESTLLISVDCYQPCSENAFCRDMGTATATDGFDLHMIDLGEVYAFRIGTSRGEALFKGFHQAFAALEADVARINERLQQKWEHFSYRLDFEVHELAPLLSASFDSSLWQELGERCLACGMCTQVCPTCYCFDVIDEVDLALEQGVRIRRWDSCQINEFAQVAGGHNFREKLAARQRHRFMRKGKYQMDAHGMVGCVGCGRCAQACLVEIKPVEVLNELYRRAQGEGDGRKEVRAYRNGNRQPLSQEMNE